MSITIETNSYVRSHGKQPKGFGRWGFEILDLSCRNVVELKFTPSSTYTEAKKFIKAYVNEKYPQYANTGWLGINVAP